MRFTEIADESGKDNDTESQPIIDRFGTKMWVNDKGEFHRLNGPAIEGIYGSKSWYQNGKLHREDGPAVEFSDGSTEWYQNDNRHREDGPAGEYYDGVKEWYQHGKLHREDGPAIITASGKTEYWKHGKQAYAPGELDESAESTEDENNSTCITYPSGLKVWTDSGGRTHRFNGPAVEHTDGGTEYWVNDRLHREDGPAIEYASGRKEWYLNDRLHREDGPAVEDLNGYKAYYKHGKRMYGPSELDESAESTEDDSIPNYDEPRVVKWYNKNGELHRVNGPAIEFDYGNKWYYQNGKLHREDGPAIERVTGDDDWFLHGKRHREDGPAWIRPKERPYKIWYKHGKQMYAPGELDESTDTRSPVKSGGYTEVDTNGNKFWYNDKGELHREDGPAMEWSDGMEAWYHNGKRHREDGPAVIHDDGYKAWYIHGKRHREDGAAVENPSTGAKQWFKHGKRAYAPGELDEGNEMKPKVTNEEKKFSKQPPQVRREGDEWAVTTFNKGKPAYHRISIDDAKTREDAIAQALVESTDLNEEDLILVPNQGRKIKPGLISPAADRTGRNVAMTKEDLKNIATNVKELYSALGNVTEDQGIPKWMQTKISLALDYLDAANHFFQARAISEEKELDSTRLEYPDGSVIWIDTQGEYHRKDGPAIEGANGKKIWFKYGKKHREDGPAIEMPDGRKQWWVNGKQVYGPGELTESSTCAGSVASVAMPLGKTQTRSSATGKGIYPNQKGGNLLTGKQSNKKFANSIGEAYYSDPDEPVDQTKVDAANKKISHKKWGGNDNSSWAVFIDSKPVYTGLTRREVPHYRKLALNRLLGN